MPYLQSEKDIVHNFRIIEKPGFNILNSILKNNCITQPIDN